MRGNCQLTIKKIFFRLTEYSFTLSFAGWTKRRYYKKNFTLGLVYIMKYDTFDTELIHALFNVWTGLRHSDFTRDKSSSYIETESW